MDQLVFYMIFGSDEYLNTQPFPLHDFNIFVVCVVSEVVYPRL